LNSVGILPLDYLSNTQVYKAQAMFGNAKQILAQFLVKQEMKKKTELFFIPFKPLKRVEGRLRAIAEAIYLGKLEIAQKSSLELVQLSLQGLQYYQKYDWFFLRSTISMGYTSWMAYTFIFILKKYMLKNGLVKKSKIKPSFWNTLGALCMALLSYLLYLKKSPFQYYFYVAFPIYFGTEVLKEYKVIVYECKCWIKTGFSSTLFKAFILLASLEILVYSYFQREVLTCCLLLGGLVWPWFLSVKFIKQNSFVVSYWTLSCLLTSVFTLLPVEKGEDMVLV
jgi:phosphatidylinositol glycan class N